MKKTILFVLLFSVVFVFGQQTDNISINWNSNLDYSLGGTSIKVPQFDTEFYNIDIPSRKIQYRKLVTVTASTNVLSLVISNVKYQTINESELYDLNKSLLPNKIQASLEVVRARDDYKGILIFSPIIKEGGVFKKVISLTYSFQNNLSNRSQNQNVIQSVSNSVLATGTWHRFYVEKSGIYKISKNFPYFF